MKIISFLETHFGLFFLSAILLALIFPNWGQALSFLIIPSLIIIIFGSFLKINTAHIWKHLKNPLLLIYLLGFYLIIIPAVLFFVTSVFWPSLALGVLLLSALPPGVATPGFTNILKGNISLSLLLTVIGHIFAPFTMVFLFYFLTPITINLDLLGIFKNLILIILVPFLIAQGFKKITPEISSKIANYTSAITVLLVGFLLYIIISPQTSLILQNPLIIIKNLCLLYGIFTLNHLIGYFLPFWRPSQDKIASSIAKTYGNNSLGIVLAAKFFTPEITLFLILSEIPFGTMLAPFKWALENLQKHEIKAEK